ncbi:MAG: hypothetical protein AAGA03_16290, partial [Planctomycetota bacterium]
GSLAWGQIAGATNLSFAVQTAVATMVVLALVSQRFSINEALDHTPDGAPEMACSEPSPKARLCAPGSKNRDP